jgi:hemoglobin
MMTIYEKYGGFEFFHKIIFELYLELFDHIEISYHFLGVNLEQLSRRQTEFLCEAIGGPKMYKGGDIVIAHKYLSVTNYEFETVAKRFAEIFRDNGLEDSEVEFIMNFIKSKRSLIVTANNTLIDRAMRFIYKKFKKLKFQ